MKSVTIDLPERIMGMFVSYVYSNDEGEVMMSVCSADASEIKKGHLSAEPNEEG